MFITQQDVKVWLQATRPFSFTASIVPVLLGAACALTAEGRVQWFLFPVFLVCAVFIHIGTNLINDYYDYKKGLDENYIYGSSGALVSHSLHPEQVRKAAGVFFILALLFGLIIVGARGWPILILGLIGIIGGYLYTGQPVSYKYIALGDIFVFLLMGVGLVLGSYFALAGELNGSVFLISLPISFLVTAILHANNIRDMKHDEKAGIKTLALILGFRAGQWHYVGLVAGAYIITLCLIFLQILPLWSLMIFFSLPLAVKNIKTMLASQPGRMEQIATLDVQTAKLHLLFGLLLILSIAAGIFGA